MLLTRPAWQLDENESLPLAFIQRYNENVPGESEMIVQEPYSEPKVPCQSEVESTQPVKALAGPSGLAGDTRMVLGPGHVHRRMGDLSEVADQPAVRILEEFGAVSDRRSHKRQQKN